MMKSDTLINYAAFQLSPKRSRCELFVSSDGNIEKLASGLVKPFVAHLKVAEEQSALAVELIKLEVERCRNAEAWFTKGTLERFVRFVSTPEVLELVNTFDAEISQLEAARKIYSQGASDQLFSTSGGAKTGSPTAADATKKELLRAIDVRLIVVKKDLATACARAAAAGFNPDTVADLQIFADRFGANRLNEACSKYISLYERRPELIINPWETTAPDDQPLRSSYSSDMSIDEDHTTYNNNNEYLNGFHRITTQKQQQKQPKLTFSLSLPIRRANTCTSREVSIEKDNNSDGCPASKKEKQEGTIGGKEGSANSTDSHSSAAAAAAARRLSVQDRISMFESKKKDSGEKPAITKPAELRRLSSDVSSGPAAVLRRWSGVSDMSLSLDLTNEKRDIDSPLPCTPSSSSSSSAVFQAKPDFPKLVKDTNIFLPTRDQSDSQAFFEATELVTTTKVVTSSGIPLAHSLNKLEDSSSRSNKSNSCLLKNAEDNDLMTLAPTSSQSQFIESWSALTNEEDGKLNIPAPKSSQSQFKILTGGKVDHFDFVQQGKSKASLCYDGQGRIQELAGSKAETTETKERFVPRTFETFSSRSADFRSASELYHSSCAVFSHQREIDLFDSQSHPREPLRKTVHMVNTEGGSESTNPEATATVQNKGSEADSLKEQVGSSVSNFKESGVENMKFRTKIIAPEQIQKSQARREESGFGNSKTALSGKSATEDQDGFRLMTVAPHEQAQRGRQSKGNQELNDELQMKAHELEKLFAEHKLRVPENQSDSARRSKPTDTEISRKQIVDTYPSEFSEDYGAAEALGSSFNVAKLNASSITDAVYGQDFGDALKLNLSGVGFSYDSRGKFYEIYMQKRNERLREEWDTKRAEKEAKMKAMHEILERNSAEMKVKLSGSTYRQDSAASARRRAERLRSFNSRSTMKMQQPLDFGQSDDDDDYPSGFLEKKTFGFDKSFSESPFSNGVSRGSESRKLIPNRTIPASTLRTAAAPNPKSAAKVSSSGRRRTQAENPLAQSIPYISDLRKENTKPSSAARKTTTHAQTRNLSRSKSSNEEVSVVKEKKHKRSHSLRKSIANPSELKDAIPLSSDGSVLIPSKFEREQAEQGESKPFLRKNNGIKPGPKAGISKMKASMDSEAMNNEEEYDELAINTEDPVDAIRDEEDEESENITTEQVAVDQSESSLSQESERLMDSGSENGDTLRTFSQVAEFPTNTPSTFHPFGAVQD